MEKKRLKKSKVTSKSFRKICRICLSNHSKLQTLFDPYKDYSFAHYINILADVKINEDDQLPSKICKGCIKELETVLSFKDKCEQSNRQLQSLLLKKVSKKNAIKNIKKDDSEKLKIKKEDSEPQLEFVEGSSTIPANTLELEISVLKEEPYSDVDNDGDTSFQNSNSEDKEQNSNLEVKEDSGHTKTSKTEKVPSGLDCLECDKKFTTEAKRKMHWYNVHKKLSFKCPTCHRVYKSSEAYNKHINQGVTCESRYDGVRIEGAGKSRMFHCTSCDYKSIALDCVRKHLVRHSGARPHACNLCPKAYTSHKSLSYHKETVHKVYKVEITCHLCGKMVEGRHRFNRHFRFTHPNNQYQCDICKAFVKSKWGLIYHLKTHDNLKEYVCETCGRTFNTPFNLRNHIRVVHEKRTFDCNICQYKSKDIKCLKNHVQQHSQGKLQCSVCFRFLDSPLKLIKHMDVHGEKKYFCLYCNKGFVRKKDCSKHERLKHIQRVQNKYNQECSPVSEEMNVCE